MNKQKKSGKLDPDESVKAVYRSAIRSLMAGGAQERAQELRAQIEFLERIYRL